MKKIFLTLTALVTLGFTSTFANGKEEIAAGNYYSTDEEVAMSVKRISGEVKLDIMVRDMSQYDHILVERSAENPNYFGKCKYISCADTKTENGRLSQADRFPYSAAKDVYYRIKTVTKDGVERAYPAVLLAASVQ